MAESKVSPRQLATKSCVVVGGGIAGQLVAKALLKKGVVVTILQANGFTEDTILSPYYVTRPELYASLVNKKGGPVVSLDRIALPGMKYGVGTATGIDSAGGFLLVDGDKKMPFDALVLATGVYYPALSASAGEDLKTRLKFVSAFAGKVSSARSILVGGAGPVALEMAAELRRLNPDCKITMVTGGPRALASWGDDSEASNLLAARLLATNIVVRTNTRIDSAKHPKMSLEPGTYAMTDGSGKATTMQADLYLPYFGQARTGFVPPAAVNARGRLKVNDRGQSTTLGNVFAVGCSDFYNCHIVPTIKAESDVVARNVEALLVGKPLNAVLDKEKANAAGSGVVGLHLGIGQWTVLNLRPLGLVPYLIGRCCGCCNPLCPCCGCCGWPCGFPAGALPSKCMEKLLPKMIGMKPHAAAVIPAAHIMTR